MSNYHYYFENKICRTIKNVKKVKVDTWIHLSINDGEEWLVNPDKVNCVRIEKIDCSNYEKENNH